MLLHPCRSPRLVRYFLTVITLCALYMVWLHYEYRCALRDKYTTTEFGPGIERRLRSEIAARSPHDGSQWWTRPLDATVQPWRLLGSGFEGTTYIYNGSVIKTFDPARLRNCLPLSYNHDSCRNDPYNQSPRLPNELPASMLLQGRPGFLGATGFFLAASPLTQALDWYLVSPFAAGGDLRALAQRVRDSSPAETYRALDLHFRPAFNGLLRSLQSLHELGFCHDDIKLSNIFVNGAPSLYFSNSSTIPGSKAEWLIADFGNLREILHPYHRSRIWIHDNGQLPDCRANDALRAVKTYLQFLRQASSDGSDHGGAAQSIDLNGQDVGFADQFFAAVEPWSRLYWRSKAAAAELRVEDVLRWSEETERAEETAHYVSMLDIRPLADVLECLLGLLIGKRGLLERAATAALHAPLSEGWARLVGMTWLLGVPVGHCP